MYILSETCLNSLFTGRHLIGVQYITSLDSNLRAAGIEDNRKSVSRNRINLPSQGMTAV